MKFLLDGLRLKGTQYMDKEFYWFRSALNVRFFSAALKFYYGLIFVYRKIAQKGARRSRKVTMRSKFLFCLCLLPDFDAMSKLSSRTDCSY